MIAHNTANNTDIDKKPVQILGNLERKASREAVRGLRGEVVTETVRTAQGIDFTSEQTDYIPVIPQRARVEMMSREACLDAYVYIEESIARRLRAEGKL